MNGDGEAWRHGGMNKLFHASKNIDARNNWFMALSADLFVTSADFFLLSLFRYFSLNGRLFDVHLNGLFPRSFSVFSPLCPQRMQRHTFGLAATKLLLFLLLLSRRMHCGHLHNSSVSTTAATVPMHRHSRGIRTQSACTTCLLWFWYSRVFSSFETCLGIFALW